MPIMKMDANVFYTGYLPGIIIGLAFLFVGPLVNYYSNDKKVSVVAFAIGVTILIWVVALYLSNGEKKVFVTISGIVVTILIWGCVLLFFSRYSGDLAKAEKLINEASGMRLQDKLSDARKKIDEARILLSKNPDAIQSGRLELEIGIIERVSGNVSLARESLAKAINLFSDRNSVYRASAHLHMGICLRQQDDRVGARKELEAALNDSRELVDRQGEGLAAVELAELSLLSEQYDKALAFVNEAETAFSATGNKLGMGSVERIRGVVERLRDRPNLSIPHLDRALAIYREMHSQAGQANVLWELGESYSQLQDFESARKHHAEGLQMAQSSGYSLGIRNGYLALANLEARRNRPEQAAQEFRRAIDYCQSANDRLGEMQARLGLATVQIQSGDTAGAKGELDRARNQAISLRDGSVQSEIEWNQAGLELREGNTSSALIRYRKSYDLAQEVGNLALQGRALRGLADALYLTGSIDEADQTLVRARTILLHAGVKDEAAMAGLSLASLRASKGDMKTCDLILTVIGEFEAINRVDLVQLARQLSSQLKCGSGATKPMDPASGPVAK